jgi:hypothetical protein
MTLSPSRCFPRKFTLIRAFQDHAGKTRFSYRPALLIRD